MIRALWRAWYALLDFRCRLRHAACRWDACQCPCHDLTNGSTS